MIPTVGSPAAVAVKSRTSSSSPPSSPERGNRPIPIELVEVPSSASSAAVADSLVVNSIPHPDVDPASIQSVKRHLTQDMSPQVMEPFSAMQGLMYGLGGVSHGAGSAAQSTNLPQFQNGLDGGVRSVTPASVSSSRSQLSSSPVKKPAFSGNRAFNATSSNGPSCAESTFFGRNPNPAVRQRTAQACEKCRDRKTKCSGTRPTCKRCADRGLVCVWAPESRSRGSAVLSKNRLQRKAEAVDNVTPSSPGDDEQPAVQSQPRRPPPLTLSGSPYHPQTVRPIPIERQAPIRPYAVGVPRPSPDGVAPFPQAAYGSSIQSLFDPSHRYAMTPRQRSLAEAATTAVATGTMTPEQAWRNMITPVREQVQEQAMVSSFVGHMHPHEAFVPYYGTGGYMVSMPDMDYPYDHGSNHSSPPSATSSHFSVGSSHSSATDYDHLAFNDVSGGVHLGGSMINTLNFPVIPARSQSDQTPRPKSNATFPHTDGDYFLHDRRISITGTASAPSAPAVRNDGAERPYVEIDFSLLPGNAPEKQGVLQVPVPTPVVFSPIAVTDSSASGNSSPALSYKPHLDVPQQSYIPDEELVAQFINTDVAYGGVQLDQTLSNDNAA